jgi:hypothetical protein
MPDAASLRDSTQILLPTATLEEFRGDLEEQFTVTVVEEGPTARIIASPVEIKCVNKFLTRHGVTVA